MSIKAAANNVFLLMVNREPVPGVPIPVFQNVGAPYISSFGIWAFPTNRIPIFPLLHVNGPEGSNIQISHDGVNWSISCRLESVAIFRRDFAPVIVNRWMALYVAIEGYQYYVYTGMEPINDVGADLVHLTLATQFGNPVDFPFGHFNISIPSNVVVCNFKYWNAALISSEVTDQMNRWNTANSGAGPSPIWSSPLRTAGDVSSIANPTPGPFWESVHGYYQIGLQADNLTTHGDPQYMANHQDSPTWVYPLPVRGAPRFFYYPGSPPGYPEMSYNPNITPPVRTTYNAPQFFYFEDRGAVPISTRIQTLHGMSYLGYPYSTGTGVEKSDTWALFEEVDHSTHSGEVPGNLGYRFEGNPIGVPLYSGITTDNLYIYKYGAQFTWQAGASVPTAIANLAWPMLLVDFTGYPTGIPSSAPPVIGPPPLHVDMGGLYVINKGGLSQDKYNHGILLKIPDPTIKTALIGE